jgi:diguanylate cyclase (GGDEF)-like protein
MKGLVPYFILGFLVIAMLAGFAIALSVRAMRRLDESEAHAMMLANVDVLTSLPNRRSLLDQLAAALAGRGDSQVAVAIVDLDGFKDVNEQRGTYVGDRLLALAAERITRAVGSGVLVARLGADEFVLVLSGPADGEIDLAPVREALSEMARPFDIGAREILVGASGGVAISPRDGMTREDLLRRADLAVRAAKARERGCLMEFQSHLEQDQQYLRAIGRDLRAGLLTGEIEVFYQPIAAADGVAMRGFEALVRWNHPVRGYISPLDFIPVAEETGLIHQLGEQVLREACQAAVKWPDLFVGVNVSPVQLRHHDFVAHVFAVLAETGLDPNRLVLEITETMLMEAQQDIMGALKELRDFGVKIALDDFGTGYSSLAYLQRFPIDKLKIDRSFIKALATGADAAAIVHCIVNLGRAVGLVVVAEGVETTEEQIFLRAAGCQELQGYKIAKPMPHDQADRFQAGRTRVISDTAPGGDYVAPVVAPPRAYMGSLRGARAAS